MVGGAQVGQLGGAGQGAEGGHCAGGGGGQEAHAGQETPVAADGVPGAKAALTVGERGAADVGAGSPGAAG